MSNENDSDADQLIGTLLNEQYQLVENYCNAATRFGNLTDDQRSEYLPALRDFHTSLQRVQCNLTAMEDVILSLHETNKTHSLSRVEEHFARSKRVLTSIFQNNTKLKGGRPPQVAMTGEVDVRLVALASLRASIRKTQSVLEEM